jgi:two-component system response regulator YesN
MYKVLIVDDEHLVRYGIKAMIDWESIGFQVIGEAGNGMEGLQAFEALAPDVVMTDIKMPVMDGMEMIAEIRALDRQAKLILLTCLEDFDYAQKALRLGTTDYLIKSNMMPQDMERVMLNLKIALDEERGDGAGMDVPGDRPAKQEKMSADTLLMGLAHGTLSASHVTESKLHAAGLAHLQGGLALLHIGLDYMEELSRRLPESELIQLHARSSEMIRDICMAQGYGSEPFSASSGEWNVLLKAASMNTATSLGEKLISRLGEIWGTSVTVGVSGGFESLTELRDAYMQAEHGYRLKLFLGCGKVIRPDTLPSFASANLPAPVMNKKLNDFLYSLDKNAVRDYMSHIFEDAEARLDVERAQLISIELLLNLTNMYSELTNDHEWLYERKKELYDQIKELETLEDRKRWLVQAYEELIGKMSSVYSSNQGAIPKVIAYIEQNYEQELSLLVISQQVHLSKNYLANLFKKETGEGLIDYITRVRIDRAKALLRSTELKSGEIGPKVGIADAKYFSKLFKKMTGVTPSEYRDAVRATSNL